MNEKLSTAARAADTFSGRDSAVANIELYGEGIIHDTFLVTLARGAGYFILQRINTRVFKDPAAIMYNLRLVCDHVSKRMKGGGIDADWQMLHSLTTEDGRDFYAAADGSAWRALSFIKRAAPLAHIVDLGDAREAGRALGIFHWLTRDLDPGLLHDTLPGFHKIETYLNHYDDAVGRRKRGDSRDEFCQRFIGARRDWATVLEKGCRDGFLKVRIIHGDPKINNIMVDTVTGKAVSIVDLDTVMAGLLQYDIADCLRSCCKVADEEGTAPEVVRFDLERCRAFWQGYTAVAQRLLTDDDVDFLFHAIRLIPFELGLRFYTDFLAGNVYFKISRPAQNLDRALVQFRLAESIEQLEEEIRAIVVKFSKGKKNNDLIIQQDCKGNYG